MAAILRFNLQRKGFREVFEVLDDVEAILERPMAGERGVKIERLLKVGVRRQFEQGGDPPWSKAHDFGTFRPAPVTLGGSQGRVAKAWENARVEKGDKEVRLRVTDKIALAHHRGTTVRPVQHPSKMQLALGLGLGVWMSQERLQVGLEIPKRPVRFTEDMVLGAKLAVVGGFQVS